MFSFFKKGLGKAPKLVPRIKTPAFVEAYLKIEGMTEDSMPIVEPLVGDLLLTYALDMGSNFLVASPQICATHNINRETLRNTAMVNIEDLPIDVGSSANGEMFSIVNTGSDMEACTILAGQFWRNVCDSMNSDVLAIFPHRNAVFFTSSESESGKSALGDMLEKIDFSDIHALSKRWYRFHNGEWSVER